MIVGQLSVGIASATLAPSVGMDLVGYLRRVQPAHDHGQPLEAGVVVVDNGADRLVLVALDILGVPAAWADEIRLAAAEVAGCPVTSVLVNASHTHAAPSPPDFRKLGGSLEFRPEEIAFTGAVVTSVTELTGLAVTRLAPAVVTAGRGQFDESVNRRQRLPDGRMALGYHPEGTRDDSVAVLSFDTLSGQPIATLVSISCHPIVVGPDVAESSSDFVGPLRDRVRERTGADCLFLQGCAGNMMPLYAMFDEPGAEDAFGSSLALEVLRVRKEANRSLDVPEMTTVYSSAVPFALWRRTDVEPDATRVPFRATTAEVELALRTPPTPAEFDTLMDELKANLAELERVGAEQEARNSLRIHLDWAKDMQQRVAAGGGTGVHTSVQLLQIGGVSIYGLPGEAFCEIGLEIKRQSAAEFPIVLGYTNDAVGYLSTDPEMDRGGYEPALSHRHYGQPAPFEYGVSEILVRAAIALDLT